MVFTRLRQFSEHINNVRIDGSAEQRRRQLLDILIGTSLIGVILLTGLNLASWWSQPSPSAQFYLISDGLSFVILLVLLWLNSIGRGYLASILFLSLSVIAISSGSTPADLNYIMVLYAFPVLASSFLLMPVASFLFASLAWLVYSMVYTRQPVPSVYNDISIIGLFAVATISWLMTGQLEKALQRAKQSKQEYETLVQSIGEGIGVVNAESRFVFVNTVAEEIFGVVSGRLVGRLLSEFVAEKNLSILDPKRTQKQEGVKSIYEIEITRGDGTVRDLIVTATTRTDRAGSFAGMFTVFRDVTAQNQAQKALRIAEAEYRAIFENAPIGIFQSTPKEGRFLRVNPAMARIYGYDSAEEMLTSISNIAGELYVNPSVREQLGQLLAQDGHVSDFESEDYRKDGSRIWTAENARAVKNSEGQILYYEGFATDITKRKWAEESLRRSEENYRYLFDNNPYPMWVYNLKTLSFMAVNDAAVEKYGYTRDEFLQMTVADIRPSEDVQRLMEDIRHPRPTLEHSGEWHHLLKNGKLIDVEITSHTLTVDGLDAALVIVQDITERKQAEMDRMKFELGLERSSEAIFLTEPEGTIVYVNPAFEKIYGYQKEDVLGKNPRILKSGVLGQDAYQHFWNTLLAKKTVAGEIINKSKDGRLLNIESTANPILDEHGEIIGFLAIQRDITEKKKAEQALLRSEEQYRLLFDRNPHPMWVRDLESLKFLAVNDAAIRHYGYSREEFLMMTIRNLRPTEDMPALIETLRETSVGDHDTGVWRHRKKDGSIIFVEITSHDIEYAGRHAKLALATDVTERKQAEEKIRSRTNELLTLYELSHALADVDNLDQTLELVNRQAVKSVGTTFARIALLEGNELVMRATYPIRVLEHELRVGDREPIASLPCCQRVLKQNEPVILRANDPEVDSRERATLLLNFAQSLCLVPLLVGPSEQNPSRVMGLLMLGEVRNEVREPLTPEKLRLARSIGDQAATTIRRMLLREQTDRRLQNLAALGDIDRAITSSFDLRISLATLLTHVIAQLHVDAADVLLFNSSLQILEFAAGRGFRTETAQHTQLRLRQSYAARVALERKVVHIPNLEKPPPDSSEATFLPGESFISYYCVPLIAKGQVKGVLEIFHRAPLKPDEEWLDFLNALARQCAIAIENTTLFDGLQRSNTELTRAYDATIEGWSRALDLRDKETEGHTERVTDMTVRLARALGLSEEEVAHIRWGTLLHDIGKMGVPDDILLKHGPLTDEEWVIMKKHPVFAYEMLSPISYLHDALDIPYCHHEKWDGTGYPRGLKGEQIPFTARIFAVVDVWDALRSDRPYRAGWSEDQVRQYIRDQAGRHFDPQIVEAFFNVVDGIKGHQAIGLLQSVKDD